MTTQTIDHVEGTIAFDDSGGSGPLLLMVPGAGDVRAEYRFLMPRLVASGFRVVTTDLRGHGESSATWTGYGVGETASDLIALLDHLGQPATVVATSFSPAAAIWAAAERPDLIPRLVLISPHLDTAPAWQRFLLRLLLRGPLAGKMWAGQFRSWHPGSPPADIDAQTAVLTAMLADPRRRKAVRDTLTADREGLAERAGRIDAPCLVVMGEADSHFSDPAAEAASIAKRMSGAVQVVPDAGHYPHVEFPDLVAHAITGFLAGTPT